MLLLLLVFHYYNYDYLFITTSIIGTSTCFVFASSRRNSSPTLRGLATSPEFKELKNGKHYLSFVPQLSQQPRLKLKKQFFKKTHKIGENTNFKILKHQPRISNQESGQRHRGPKGIGIVCGTDRTGGSAPASFDMHHGAHVICPSSPALDFQPGPEQWTSSGIGEISAC